MADVGGTSSVSGLFSGIDFRSTIESIIAIEHRSVDLIQSQVSVERVKLAAWQAFNKLLLALKSAGDNINRAADLQAFSIDTLSSSTTDAEDILSVTTTTDAQPGSYTVEVQNRAEARKISSKTFTSDSTGLGLSGEFLVNGRAVSVSSTDTLSDIRDNINNLNGGTNATKVTATILTVTEDSDYRLVITSNETGVDKLFLQDASTTNILESGGLGFNSGTMSTKNSVSPDDAASDYFASSSATIGSMRELTSAPSGTIQINGTNVTINLGTMSLSNIKTAIDNASIANITTAISSTTDDDDETIYRLEIVDSTGAPTFLDSNNVLEALGVIESTASSQLVAEADARILVDSVQIDRDTNVISDAVEGMSFNLLQDETGTSITVNVNRDLDAAKTRISMYVEAYNDVIDFVKTQLQADDADTENTVEAGILSGDSSLTSSRSVIRNVAAAGIVGLPDDYDTLSDIGVEFTSEGKLKIDNDKLTTALQTDFDAVKRVFIAEGTATNSDVEYISHTEETQAGDYSVSITTAATQTSVTGTSDLSSNPLTSNETFTITDLATGRVGSVGLSIGDDIDVIVNAINSELGATEIETHIGDVRNTTDGSTAITSATTWNAIQLGTPVSDNDTISISGTTRSGLSIDDQFIISSASTGTVQDFLSYIENAFEKEVTASIDDGYIVVKDIKGRDSSFTLTLGESAGSLDFGTINTSNNSTNESGQEGRYAMGITASKNGSNNLVLTHENYGDGFDFTVSDSAQMGILDTNVTVGVDVVGTIGGETADGDGQILTGAADEQNIDGLVIRYTGTSTGTMDNVKMTLGVGELMERELDFITNTLYDGFVALRMETIEDRIDTLLDRISDMEDRLDKRRQYLLNKYVSMESTLAVFSSRSLALASQLKTLQSLFG